MTKGTLQDPPVWLSDYEDIFNLLSDFLDKLDKGKRLLTRLTPKSVPSLFDYNNSDAQLIWTLIQMLETDFGIITIKPERAQVGKEIYDNAKVRFNPEREDVIRGWLARPKQTPYINQWWLAVDSLEWSRLADMGYIRNNPLTFSHKHAVDIARNLSTLEKSLTEPKTLRHLSARYFWGDSKFLDNKAEYLLAAFPYLKENILARPILVNLHIPEQYSSVLFIENQDTFLMLANQLMALEENTTAIVYTAGFRGAANRIRKKGSYVFSTLSQTSTETLDRFTIWWEQQMPEAMTPCFFWGDLDYSGFGILSSLRSKFIGMNAWKPAYDVMLQHLLNGASHSVISSNKGTQIDPGTTNCWYSDTVLLPAIRDKAQFVDQEIVEFCEIENSFISRE